MHMVYLAYKREGGYMLSTVNTKYEYIDLINLMVGITSEEKKRLSKLSLEEVETRYYLIFKEKSEEML